MSKQGEYENQDDVMARLRFVFEVVTNSDTTEGRGVDVTVGFFLKEQDARDASHGKGVMGLDADVKKTRAVVWEENGKTWCTPLRSVARVWPNNIARLCETVREQALRKLTDEEQEALGLKVRL